MLDGAIKIISDVNERLKSRSFIIRWSLVVALSVVLISVILIIVFVMGMFGVSPEDEEESDDYLDELKNECYSKDHKYMNHEHNLFWGGDDDEW
jgi:hypothetical protein